MAKFNPKKIALVTDVQGEVAEVPVTDLPKEAEGEGYLADFARFAEQGFIGSSTTKE